MSGSLMSPLRLSAAVMASEPRSPLELSPMASRPGLPGHGCRPAPLVTGSTNVSDSRPSNAGTAGLQQTDVGRPAARTVVAPLRRTWRSMQYIPAIKLRIAEHPQLGYG